MEGPKHVTAIGLRGQIFVAILISTIVGAITAGIASYHVFERGLDAAFEARLQLIVDEAERVIDTGIRAGLTIDQPHLLQRAVAAGTSAEGAVDVEIISVVDSLGRIIASTNSAEIGELAPEYWAANGQRARSDASEILATQQIDSLFGTSEGLIVARLPLSVMEVPSEAFLFRVSLTTTAAAIAVIVFAVLVVWLVPWPFQHRAENLREMMDDLYQQIGGSEPNEQSQPLPDLIETTASIFHDKTIEISDRLRRENDELTRLDEVA